MSDLKKINSALISVFNKDNLEPIINKLAELKIEIFDPDGKSKGHFIIIAEGDISSGNKTIVQSEVNGEMERHYREPVSGEWKVVFTPKNAVGLARLRTNLIFNPRVDMLEVEQIEEDTDANIK